jgi:hypothetical protein
VKKFDGKAHENPRYPTSYITALVIDDFFPVKPPGVYDILAQEVDIAILDVLSAALSFFGPLLIHTIIDKRTNHNRERPHNRPSIKRKEGYWV